MTSSGPWPRQRGCLRDARSPLRSAAVQVLLVCTQRSATCRRTVGRLLWRSGQVAAEDAGRRGSASAVYFQRGEEHFAAAVAASNSRTRARYLRIECVRQDAHTRCGYGDQRRKHRLMSAIRSLDPQTRDVFLLRFIEQMSVAEVAAAVGEPVGTVKSRLNRGRKRLSEILRPTSKS